ncbi:vacuolar fusion protein MON1 homolog A [Harmonia axyridis]|uniref:vacuolar fusion protein MON1 homolog A n=1 Tax=Harmonia axyridis TaxID=115357 RepID=UPI001E276919|nr:vacuolar fusion protein MON1 homolog A [Harmonia axyridis]
MSYFQVEPGAAGESLLSTTDNTEDVIGEQMSSSLEEIKNDGKPQETEDCNNETLGNVSSYDDISSPVKVDNDDGEILQDQQWALKEKHIFVLSMAGKPIYSRYGNEDKLAWLFGVMQTLVSFVQSNDDNLISISVANVNFVFSVKKPLILVAVSRKHESIPYLQSQLNCIYNQIASTLTTTKLIKIYEQRQNYDLRRLLSGVERLISHLLDFSETEPAFLLGAIQCLNLSSNIRGNISSAIISSCSKIKNIVFAILMANNKLITLVRMKKYSLHPADLHLIFNLVQSTESFKTVESWAPICLPRFDPSGFLYGYVSYLAEDCQACLLLLTVERDVFHTLKEAKQRIVEKLRRNNCLEAINESLAKPDLTCMNSGFKEVRHYLYKSKSTAQFYQPSSSPPYNKYPEVLSSLYKRLHRRLHCSARPLKLLFERRAAEAIFAWDTVGFELYIVFEPLIETRDVVDIIAKLLSWMKERDDNLFHLHVPTF